MVPTATPRRARNHVDAIFIAGGYTPAKQQPAAKRDSSARRYDEVLASGRLANAPNTAAHENSNRAGMTSARFSNALSAVPTTKPNCTAVVSHPTSDALKLHTFASDGPTALPVNHNAMPSNSAHAKMPNMRHRSRASCGASASSCTARAVLSIRAAER